MITKVSIPLEDVPYSGADKKVRLRYRLVSKDKNETSQWSSIYTINPEEVQPITVNDIYSNPVFYSGWTPTSYTDEDNLFINFDGGWINNKRLIPYKNFDAFVSWNFADSIINIPKQTPTLAGTIITLTTSVTHNIRVGKTIIISGVTPDAYNGTWVTKSGTTGTTIKIDIGFNPGPITIVGTIDIVERWGYEVSKNATIEASSITTPSGYYTFATLTNIDTKNLNTQDLIKGKPGSFALVPDNGTLGGTATSTTITKLSNNTINVLTYDPTGTSPDIVAGTIVSISKFSATNKSYGYAGSSADNGQIVVKIPKQIYTDNNVIQYKYYLVPRTNPPTLLDTSVARNYVYLSPNLTTKPTLQISSLDNTIDGGSPS